MEPAPARKLGQRSRPFWMMCIGANSSGADAPPCLVTSTALPRADLQGRGIASVAPMSTVTANFGIRSPTGYNLAKAACRPLSLTPPRRLPRDAITSITATVHPFLTRPEAPSIADDA
jgi:hypothetical protein